MNLINVFEAILTPRHLGLVMEVADGGSLTTSVAQQASGAPRGQLVMPEEEARYYFTQFVEAMAYCHQHGIAHRWAWLRLRSWWTALARSGTQLTGLRVRLQGPEAGQRPAGQEQPCSPQAV